MFRSLIDTCATTALVLAVAFTAVTAAQQKEFAEAQQANQAALRQYSWKSRTELKVDGEIKQVRLEQVRYDIDGRLQKTLIGGSQAPEASRPGPPGPARAIKKQIVEKKKEEFKDMLGDLAALAESYAHLSPERMKAFAARAAVTKGQGIETGSVRIQGRDVQAMGDQIRDGPLVERRQVKAGGDPLRQLPQGRIKHHVTQLGLAHQHKLNDLVLARIDVGQHPKLFEAFRRKVLGLVEYEHDPPACRIFVDQKILKLLEKLHIADCRVERHAQRVQDPLDQFATTALRVRDQAHGDLRTELAQQLAQKGRLAATYATCHQRDRRARKNAKFQDRIGATVLR